MMRHTTIERRGTNRIHLASMALAAVLALTGSAAAASPAPQAETAHAPVSFWVFPSLSTGGTTGELETNLALTLGLSRYARLSGVDLSVVGSVVTREMVGLQATSGFNYALDGSGVQLAAAANIAGGRLAGLQASAGYNHAAALRGAQIGLLNYGGDVKGAQIGLLNIGGRVKGTQLGLLNLADDVDAPVGLVNISRKGQHTFNVWSSDSAPLNAGFKLGGRYLYSVLAAGLQPGEDRTRWMVGLGLGGHIPVSERFFIETDLVGWQINDDEAWTDELNILGKLRVLGGYRVATHFSVFAGASLNVLTTRVDDGSDFGLITGKRLTDDGDETTVRIWPGFVAGFQI